MEKMNEKLCSFSNSLICTPLVSLGWRLLSGKKVHLSTQYHTIVPFYQRPENGEVLIGVSSRPGFTQDTFLWIGFLCVKGWSWTEKKTISRALSILTLCDIGSPELCALMA